MNNPVALDFAMKHLLMFSKSAMLSKRVTLCLSNDSPLMVEFQIEDLGYLRYYLAPKIDDEQ
jgi:proliferating cell nuclear antigen